MLLRRQIVRIQSNDSAGASLISMTQLLNACGF